MMKRRFLSSIFTFSRQNANKSIQTLRLSRQGFILNSINRPFSSIDIPLPPLADSIDSGTLATWEKAVGDFCAVDETIAVIDTDKVSVDVKSPQNGEITELLAEEGDELKVGDIIARIVPKEAPEQTETPKTATAEKTEETQTDSQPVVKEPEPTPKPATQKASTPTPKAPAETTPVSASRRGVKIVKMTPIRKKTAERLKSAQNTAASLTTFNEIDMTELINLRNKYKDAFLEKHGTKLGFMSAFIKASVAALQEIPVVNARIDDEGQNIIFHDYIDVSVAVSSPKGLVVPVLRNVEEMSFLDVEKEIVTLGTKAKEGKLTLEDMSGGTFTVTNGGVFGSLMSTPMINSPQSAILGMHAVKERAFVVNGEIKIRPIMIVALTYDHRIIDGRESVTFLKSIKEKVEDPHRLLLDL